jgi:reticulon-4-interacting protein 1, mitochondrial
LAPLELLLWGMVISFEAARDNNNNNDSTMKCIVYGRTLGSYHSVANRSIPTLVNANTTVLVRVHAVGLNPVDAKGVVGDKVPAVMRPWLHRLVTAGKIPGFDFSGTVVQQQQTEKEEEYEGTSNNSNQQQFQCGQAVFGIMPPFQGTLAEYIRVPTDQIWHMPKQIKSAGDDDDDPPTNEDFIQAAALPLAGLTALQCLGPLILHTKQTNPTTRQQPLSVLIIGASGGTGHVAIQVANCLFQQQQNDSTKNIQYHITAVCSTRNVDFCRQLGATHVVDYTAADAEPLLVHALKAAPGWPYDVVMDCVTSDDPRDVIHVHYPSLLQTTGVLNRDYVYRRLGGPPSDWMRAGCQLIWGARSSSISSSWWWPNQSEQLFWISLPQTVPDLVQLYQWTNDGKLCATVNHVYSFSAEGVTQAMDDILSRRVRGKVVVQVYPPLVEKVSISMEDEPTTGVDGTTLLKQD